MHYTGRRKARKVAETRGVKEKTRKIYLVEEDRKGQCTVNNINVTKGEAP
jgi:hypothetical protein